MKTAFPDHAPPGRGCFGDGALRHLGCQSQGRIITPTFGKGGAFRQSGAVFGLKRSLIASLEPVAKAERNWRSTYDFGMHKGAEK